MPDITTFDGVSGTSRTAAQLLAIIEKIDLDIYNLLNGDVNAAANYKVGDRTVERGEYLRWLIECRKTFERQLASLPLGNDSVRRSGPVKETGRVGDGGTGRVKLLTYGCLPFPPSPRPPLSPSKETNMPLPIYPTLEGAPGDGNLIAIHGGVPTATTEIIGGLIELAQAVESYVPPSGLFPAPNGTVGEPLIANGVTIWLRGSLNLNIHGDPTVTDFAEMLSRWDTVRNKLRLTIFEVFLYYHPAAPVTYRKYKSVTAHLIRSYWNNPVSLGYLVALVTTDKALYVTGPGV